jgi:hypothetical protein
VKGFELQERLQFAFTYGPGFGKASKDIVMLSPYDGMSTYPITGVHFDEALGAFVVTSWKEEHGNATNASDSAAQ